MRVFVIQIKLSAIRTHDLVNYVRLPDVRILRLFEKNIYMCVYIYIYIYIPDVRILRLFEKNKYIYIYLFFSNKRSIRTSGIYIHIYICVCVRMRAYARAFV